MKYCFVYGCKNNQSNSTFAFFRFPVDENERRTWIKRIRRDPSEYETYHRICSWHFPNGKDNGPTKFVWNENKSFDLYFPEIKSRKSREKAEGAMLKEVTATDASNEEIDLNLVHQDSSNVIPKRRKQSFISTTYNFQQESSTSEISTKNNDTEESLPRLKEQCEKYKAELLVEKEKSTQLEMLVEHLRREVTESNKKVLTLQQQVNHLSSKGQSTEDGSILASEHDLKSNLVVEKNKMAEQEKQCLLVCQKFNLDEMSKWKPELLNSFIGFQDFSSIKILIDILLERSSI